MDIKNTCVYSFFIIFEINQPTMENTLKKMRQLIRTYRLKKGYS